MNTSIPGATKADSDAVLLLENLKFSNYVNRDRRNRLDRDEIKAILKVLHAISYFLSNFHHLMNKMFVEKCFE